MLNTHKHIETHTHPIPIRQHPSVVSGSSTFTLAFGSCYHLAQWGVSLYNPKDRIKGFYHDFDYSFNPLLTFTHTDSDSKRQKDYSFISNELRETTSDREQGAGGETSATWNQEEAE